MRRFAKPLIFEGDTINTVESTEEAKHSADITSNNKMFALFSSIVFLCFTLFSYCSAEDVCLSDTDSDCGTTTKENKYLKGLFVVVRVVKVGCCKCLVIVSEINGKYDYYLEQIQKAKEEYVPCNITNCQCYLPVIQNDLRTFKSGITRKLLDNVKLKLVVIFCF